MIGCSIAASRSNRLHCANLAFLSRRPTAKEVALDAFLGRRIRFTDMASVVSRTLDRLSGDTSLPTLGPDRDTPGLDDVLEADRIARLRAADVVERMRE